MSVVQDLVAEDSVAAVSAPLEKRKRIEKFRRTFRMWVTFPFLIVLLLMVMGFSVAYIPSESMEPNLVPGDNVVTMRAWAAYSLGRAPARGDIVVFRLTPEQAENAALLRGEFEEEGEGKSQPEHLIKRVVGLPGETIEVKGSDVYINGKKLQEDYPVEPLLPDVFDPFPFAEAEPFQIPEGMYFVLGDNRRNSEDSRFYGPIKQDIIVGKYIAKLYHGKSDSKPVHAGEP